MRLTWVLIFGVLMACGGLRPVGEPSVGGATADFAVLGPAVRDALTSNQMSVVQNDGNTIVAQWGNAQRGFRVRIAFEPPGYTVTLIDSVGFKQRVDARTGQVMIHGRYHRLIDRLHRYVSRNLGSAGRATGARGSNSDERVIATSVPAQIGWVERGLLVAGQQIDQLNESAGLATTQPIDTGYLYGFVQGENATLFASYTATIYPQEVRIRLQLRKCARVMVQVGVNLVQQIQCEPMDGATPANLRVALDDVSAAIEREIRALSPTPAVQPVEPQQPAVEPAPVAPAQPSQGDSVFVD
ncbi:MAG: hypothetical protein AAF411_17275 [Myxococcota bacterium]